MVRTSMRSIRRLINKYEMGNPRQGCRGFFCIAIV